MSAQSKPRTWPRLVDGDTWECSGDPESAERALYLARLFKATEYTHRNEVDGVTVSGTAKRARPGTPVDLGSDEEKALASRLLKHHEARLDHEVEGMIKRGELAPLPEGWVWGPFVERLEVDPVTLKARPIWHPMAVEAP